ncbi:MAG: hypothetical protein JJE34_06690 [Alphaproteobacteria bacterium]|nr:hypothetical protein [Alphaproteobacteria bacterium]
MNDFLARNSNIQPSRSVERASKAVLESQASQQAATRHNRESAGKAAIARLADNVDVDQQVSSAADVAEAQAKIADLLMDISMMRNAAHVEPDAIEAQIAALLPKPMVIVPMPPANRDAIERAIETAETIRASAVVALSAQANVPTDIAEGTLA